MTDRILSPYSFKAQELQLISDRFVTHTDWSKSCFDGIKLAVKNDLRPKQGNLCCYCKWELGFDIKEVDIEHIVPKSEYSEYTFHPNNLSLSCPGCNTNKWTKPVLSVPITAYPTDGINVSIVHAHFDDYSQHIERHADAIYEGLSPKGRRTIKLCKLDRLKDVLKKMKAAKSKDTQIAQLVAELRQTNDTQRSEEIKLELSQLTEQFL
ncbi:hypothetical protein P20311_0644 [Pseudoalteromonas sp. BSi20311]|uniref:HNH endonuclease n=1 Tax=Pseudoalteromonas TaxID=53246 RepID=UPI0002317129|nr:MULTISPECIES: HNH endonuclease [Pseudoalteromonas]MDB2356496.1 HNH endonuclease [Pseudoalteromonas sp.]MDO6834247.1 HNH endonuclease [Pseudoalteromonas carrageenovora]GAA62871.1 hypothetical protein P20311_0644 [Pseudoalteromonas sp. BSi20311]